MRAGGAGHLGPPAASTVYELTERGRQLKPVLLALGAWGLPLLDAPRPGEQFRPAWLTAALDSFYQPDLTVTAADREPFLGWITGRLTDRQAITAGLSVTGGGRGLRRLRAMYPATPPTRR